jgi:putative two-component system response regulator
VEGFAMAIAVQPDVILLDVMMPEMNGFEVCRSIRSTASLHEVPIMMITSLDDRRSRLTGLEAGADDFISKPFDGMELVTRLRGMARLNRYRLIAEQRRELETLHTEILIAYDRMIEGWSSGRDLRDKEAEEHTQRVTKKTILLARAYGTSELEQVHIRRGALLHDVGKLGIPDSILLKTGLLTDEERIIMKRHPAYAYEWLSQISYLHPALDIPNCHHEKRDGSGYPRGLKGEQIPISARLFAVVDVWDAITSDRSYRKALVRDDAQQYILSQSSLHFDPAIVQLFIMHVDQMQGVSAPGSA